MNSLLVLKCIIKGENAMRVFFLNVVSPSAYQIYNEDDIVNSKYRKSIFSR